MAVNTGKYNSEFYSQQGRKEKASNVFSLVLKFLPQINSVVDFGCGLGSWLAVLKKLGIKEIKGYDGFWVNKESLEIPEECFTAVNLDQVVSLEKRYDLAISIEVAEHLPQESAKIFVETLTKASDIILFSAAIPYQGGVNHINEQWQSYWYDLFREFDYVGIDIRSLIWNDNKIDSIYKQNMILYVKKDKTNEINIPEECYKISGKCLNIVHPDIYMNKANAKMRLFHLYLYAIKRTIQKFLGK